MHRLSVILVLVTVIAAIAPAQKRLTPAPRGVTVAYAKQAQQGFSMTIWLSNQMVMGERAWDDAGGIPTPFGLEYPVGSGIQHLYGAAPMVGGIINGTKRVSEGWNGDSDGKFFLPDARHPARERLWHTSTLNLGEPNRRGVDDDGDGRVDEDELDGIDNDGDWDPAVDDVGSDGIADAMETGCRGGYDAVANPDPAGDDYDPARTDVCHPLDGGALRRQDDPDLYTERNAIPDHGERHVDEDYGAVSESDYLMSATDTTRLAGHTPMGLKLVQRSYAWSRREGEAILPMEYTLVNIGTNVIRDGFVAFWVDPNVGPTDVFDYAQHDYTCAMPAFKTVYSHNAIDRGSTPIGLTTLGFSADSGWSTWAYRIFDFGSPTPGTIDDWLYCYVMFCGAWWPEFPPDCGSPTNPVDTRFLMRVGRFDRLSPGDSITFSVAFVSGVSLDVGAGSMLDNLQRAIVMHDRGFHLPDAPPSPKLRVRADDRLVRLDWSYDGTGPDPLDHVDPFDKRLAALPDTHWRRRDNPDPQGRGGRAFEGFTVWRSSSEKFDSASFAPIARYDVADDLGYGMQTGLRYTYLDTTATPGRTYWYAVTSYAVPTEVVFPPTPIDPVPPKAEAPGLESSVRDNATRLTYGYGTAERPGKVLVVPNPYRADNKYPGGGGVPAFEGAFHGDNGLLWFLHLPAKATIRIFSLAGDAIATINHDDAVRAARGQYTGQEEWRILSDSGIPLSSGIYVFSVETGTDSQIGKFVILR